jgi:hypothetical protein
VKVLKHLRQKRHEHHDEGGKMRGQRIDKITDVKTWGSINYDVHHFLDGVFWGMKNSFHSFINLNMKINFFFVNLF